MELVISRTPRRSQQARDLQWWRSRSMAERLAAVEDLRRQAHADDSDICAQTKGPDAEPRLQRVCRVVARESR